VAARCAGRQQSAKQPTIGYLGSSTALTQSQWTAAFSKRLRAKMIPGAKLSVYQGIGHSPFFEDAPRFNAELAAFVRSAQKGN
jgi:pimeloyl-ACP methyl ester carboxylesterase